MTLFDLGLDNGIEKEADLTDRPKKRANQNKCKYCDNIIGYGSRGMCNRHYMKYKRHGNPLHEISEPKYMIEGYCRDRKTRRRLHRIIWETHYNVILKNTEIIHHINLVKTDNRIENLWKYNNASEHIKAHENLKRISKTLREDEEIVFDRGEYIKRKKAWKN